MILVFFLGCLYIGTSAGIIGFNKFLMSESRFPFAVALVVLHSAFCSILTMVLYCVKPSLFPSLTDPDRRVAVDSRVIFGGALPIAFFFSVQLVLSNTAYLHSSVAFLQMMKEANLVFVYTLSLVFVLERFSWRCFWVLIGVLLATAMTIHGELNFSFTGFCMQGISGLCESFKIVLQAMLLTSAGKKLDALTYVLLVMPLCFVILSTFWGILVFFNPTRHFLTPEWSDFTAWWPYLIANCMVAFALNIVIALFVKHSSAIAFILAGICKDAAIVLAGGLVFAEIITALQALGFFLQLCLICVWSLMKTFPETFEGGILVGLHRILTEGPVDKPKLQPVDDKKSKSYGSA